MKKSKFLTENDLCGISKIFDALDLQSNIVEQIDNAVSDYLGAKQYEEFLVSNGDRQKQICALVDAAAQLEFALRDLDGEVLSSFAAIHPVNIDIDSIGALKSAALASKEKFPSRGPAERRARNMFVRSLIPIYEQLTRKSPGRSFDFMSGLDTGDFLEFARAILLVVDPSARKGIEHVIRDVLKPK